MKQTAVSMNVTAGSGSCNLSKGGQWGGNTKGSKKEMNQGKHHGIATHITPGREGSRGVYRRGENAQWGSIWHRLKKTSTCWDDNYQREEFIKEEWKMKDSQWSKGQNYVMNNYFLNIHSTSEKEFLVNLIILSTPASDSHFQECLQTTFTDPVAVAQWWNYSRWTHCLCLFHYQIQWNLEIWA